MKSERRIQKKIWVFLFLTFAFSAIAYYEMISTGTARKVGGFWMFSPGIAAILTKLIFRENLQEFGWQLGERKYLFLGLGIPFLYALSIYSFVWLTGLGEITFPPFSQLLIFATLGLLSRIIAALGEEIGWRGLLTPELIKITSFTKTVIITGIIWAVWHYPATIYADYNNPSTPIVFQLVVFTVAVIGYSSITAWLRIKSGSIWPAVIWHGGHNVFIQQIFMMMTKDTGKTFYFVDDFGIGVLVASIILGFVFWTKRSELHGIT